MTEQGGNVGSTGDGVRASTDRKDEAPARGDGADRARPLHGRRSARTIGLQRHFFGLLDDLAQRIQLTARDAAQLVGKQSSPTAGGETWRNR